jgi:general secretion pathway protein K
MRRRGFVLVVVVFFVVLLFSVVAALLRRSTLDAAIVRNRDHAGRAEALARGGVRLAVVLLQQDRLDEARGGPPLDGPADLWALASQLDVTTEDGGGLRVRVEDAGARIDLNSFAFVEGEQKSVVLPYLSDLLQKVIDEMPGRPEEKRYDAEELARNLIDYVDADDVGQRGDPEDAWYQEQDPPYRAANGPLPSLDELALVRGFDRDLVAALAPYVTVHPLSGGPVNLNTAPTWVLAALHFGGTFQGRLPTEGDVRQVDKARTEEGACESGEPSLGGESFFPPLGCKSDVFTIEATAEVGDVRRRIEAVVDRSDPAAPVFWAWRVRPGASR